MASPCFPHQLKQTDLDKVFTPDIVADLWSYGKATYLDRGARFGDMIHGVASDLGIRPEWLDHAFSSTPERKRLVTEMYLAQSRVRQAKQEARAVVEGIGLPFYQKAINTILKAPFAAAVYGHGTVGMQTHAGAMLFRPSSWNTYFSNFFRQFGYWRNPAMHEAAMQRLVHDPNYTLWNRAGLAVNPDRTYTDYGAYAKFLGKMGEPGKRGFDTLKVYRLEQANSEWERLPASIKNDPQAAPAMAKNIAELINHSTGVADIGHGPISKGVNQLAFAAKLEASRWARVIGDPIETVNTFLNWKNASGPDRQLALIRMRNAAEFGAFYVTTLLANNAILAATESKQRVNLTDPTKSDWLLHKVGDHTLRLEGSLLAPLRFLARLGYIFWGPRSRFEQSTHETRFHTAADAAGDYLRGKLAPTYSIMADVLSKSDYSGRPLPFSADTHGKHQQPYTLPEYALQHGPIPLSGASREVYDSFRQRGMSALQTTALMRGLSVLGAEMTGAKVGRAGNERPNKEGVSQRP